MQIASFITLTKLVSIKFNRVPDRNVSSQLQFSEFGHWIFVFDTMRLPNELMPFITSDLHKGCDISHFGN